MKIVRDIDESELALEAQEKGTVITIGAFDGVHLGHRAVLRLVRELADARGLRAALATFDRHPAEVVRPDSAPKLLTTLDHRLELLDATGLLDLCLVLTFDEARSHESAEDFVHEVLAGLLHARLVVVGADFHFGHRRGGNVALLEQMGADLGFEVLGLGLVASRPASVPFSSTHVRELLAAGDVEGAAEVLGRPHELRGTLAEGGELLVDELLVDELLVDNRMCLPAAGSYTGTLTDSDGSARPAVIAVGTESAGADVRVVTAPGGPADGPCGSIVFRAPVSVAGHDASRQQRN